MNNAAKIQAVINTLAKITVPATHENVNMLLGIHNTLAEVRDSLAAEEAEDDAGTADNE